MTALRKQTPLNYEEYIALDKGSDRRWEYYDGEVVCMSGGTARHNDILLALTGLVARKLKDGCDVVGGDVAIKTALLPHYRYADLVVVCGKAQYESHYGIGLLLNPTTVVEVLSPDTEDLDINKKLPAYQAIESMRSILLLRQEMPQVTQYMKIDDRWIQKEVAELQADVQLAGLESDLRLADIYRRVTFK
ncbi:MAG: Uma2 family endonuclease [Blastocatellia bacterium]|nr:Uma2 family endonuclease [Blastocatellia bacterium]